MSISDVVDLHVTARGVLAAERRTAVDASTGARIDRSGLPAEVVAALDAAVRLAQQVLDGDNAILVRGGLVTNDPVLPVVNLEFLEDDDVCIEEATEALDRATALGWPTVAAEVREYLERHAVCDEETGHWSPRPRVRESVREAFTEAVRTHFRFPPSTWTVQKRGPRSWDIMVGPEGERHSVESFTTKRAAALALATREHSFRRAWEARDRWYLGTSRDHRERPLEPWEREVVVGVRRELADAAEATSGADDE